MMSSLQTNNKHNKFSGEWLIVALFALLLGACGGGGGGGGSSTPAVPAATSPTAFDASISTSKNTAVDGILSASDQDGDPLTYSIVSNATIGAAVLTNPAAGSFTYTPTPGAEGVDSFTFKANDGSRDSNTATVTVTISNAPAVALDSSASTNENVATGTLNLSVINDDGDALLYRIVSNGTLGNAQIIDDAAGTYVYTPTPGQYGTDTFTFVAEDRNSSASSNIATVTITINGQPIVTGSCGTVRQANQSPGYVGKLTADDPETPMQLMYSLLNPDDTDAGLTLVTAKGGTVTITDATTGLYTYQAATAAGDHRGRDTFRFQVSDPEGAVASATETVVVDQTIMPLGDSITMGDVCIGDTDSNNKCIADASGNTFNLPQDKVGYRKPLFDTLTGLGFGFDFVGSRSHGFMQMTDSNHEGWGGWSAFDLAWGQVGDGSDGAFAWLERNPADVVLLHAGTNDISNTTADDIADILDEIDRWETSANGNPVTVIVARIIDWSPNNPAVATLNNGIETLVNNRIANGDDLVLVDQQSGAGMNYTLGVDMSDQLHPTASGYQKMHTVWSDALAPVLDKCP